MRKLALIGTLALTLAACGSSDETTEGNTATRGEGAAKATFDMPPVTQEGYLKLKPGLWTRTATAMGQDLGEDRICIDESVYKDMQPKRDIARVLGDDCDDVQQTASQKGIAFTTVCRRLGETQVEGLMTGTDQILRTEIKTKATQTGGGADYVVESKYAGECPADMKPGDTGQ